MALAGCPAEERADDPTETVAGTTEEASEEEEDSGPPPTSTSGPSETTVADAEESGSTTTPDVGTCSGNKVCLGKPPLGWTGPVVVAKAGTPEDLPNCKDPYPGNDLTRFEGFHVPGQAECTCECGLTGATCTMYSYHGAASCYTTYTPGSEGCVELNNPIVDGIMQAYSYPAFGASCDQQAEEIIEEIPWDAIVKGCTGGVDTDEVCDANGRLCYKRPDDGYEQQICYMAEGDIPCPPNTDYSEKTIRYTSVEDTRDCTSCQCGMLSTCLTNYDVFDNTDCSGAPSDTINNGVCTNGVTAQSIMYDLSGLQCPILSESEPEGEATPTDPWTYCCAPLN